MDDETVDVTVRADVSEMTAALDDLAGRARQFGNAMTDALKSAATGGRSLDDVLKQLALRLSDIALDAALKPVSDLFSEAIGSAFSALSGSAASAFQSTAAPSVTPFAKGGVVASPSYFPAGGTIGLMGEAGAEAILPLRRGSDGALGVAMPGGGREARPAITFNVTATDAPSFLKAETQIQAMLARAAGRGRRGL